MDPNKALLYMLAALTGLRAAERREDTDTAHDFAMEVAEHAETLDQWLSAGGFLPKRWTDRNVAPKG